MSVYPSILFCRGILGSGAPTSLPTEVHQHVLISEEMWWHGAHLLIDECLWQQAAIILHFPLPNLDEIDL
jgi:hypothetical protein